MVDAASSQQISSIFWCSWAILPPTMSTMSCPSSRALLAELAQHEVEDRCLGDIVGGRTAGRRSCHRKSLTTVAALSGATQTITTTVPRMATKAKARQPLPSNRSRIDGTRDGGFGADLFDWLGIWRSTLTG